MKIDPIAKRLGDAQAEHPKTFLVIAGFITAVMGVVASGLIFNASYEALLPEDSPELVNVDNVRAQTGGTRQIVAVLTGADPEKRLAFAEKMGKALEKIDDIRYVDVKFPVSFFEERGMWLMDPATLDELIPALEEAVRVSKWQANPMNLQLDPEKDKAELEAAWGKVDAIVKKKQGDTPFSEVLESKDKKTTFALIVPKIKFADVEIGRKLITEIQRTIASLQPGKLGIEVKTAGNLDIVQEQNITMVSDLRAASIFAFSAIILIVSVVLRRVTAPFLIGVSLLFGVTWTFALARIIIGQVNIITGFLVAVLIGLGIDFGIHLFVRFEQALKLGGKSVKDAVRETVKGTLPPALTGALTTSGTFFSFILADFRGFSEFGLIAGIGVIFTLFSSFLVLPPLLVLFAKPHAAADKAAPMPRTGPFVRTPVAVLVTVLFFGAAAFGSAHITDVPFKNNFRKLRGESPATTLADWVDQNLGAGFNPAVFLATSVKEAAAIKTAALAQKESGFGGRKSRISNVFTVSDLLPMNRDEVAPKIAKLKDILLDKKLDRAEEKGGKRAKQLKLARKMVQAQPWDINDLPQTFKRRLTTLDGKKYLVFVWPDKRNDADVEAAEWEDELHFLSTTLAKQHLTHQMADETLVLSWIYRTIVKDGPPLFIVASIVVLLFLVLDFTSLKKALLVAFPLVTGMLLFAAAIRVFGMELNMFNMIVLPSVVGIGVDNAVHIFHRYVSEGKGSLKLVVRTTGVAALLASVTTGIGFGACIISHNVGLQTLGIMAIVGISATFLSATLFFPCFLSLIERRDK